MPYKKNFDLPQSIKTNLPQRAQTIFRKAFNNAIHHYNTEEQAFKVAWSAVKNVYEKDRFGKWVKKP